jgi:hypothetical protein
VGSISAQAPPDEVCADGSGGLELAEGFVPEAIVVPSSTEAWAAGGHITDGGRRQAAVMRFDGSAWAPAAGPSGGSTFDDSNFTGLDGTAPGSLWAVGYGREPTGVVPIAAQHRTAWSWVDVPTPRQGSASLADVGTDVRRGTWAVGVRVRQPGVQDPLVLRRTTGAWRDVSPALPRGQHGALSSVEVTRDAIWIGGHILEGSAVRPYLARRTRGGWERATIRGVGEGAISDIAVTAEGRGWAVGHQLVGGRVRALVLRLAGSRWREAAAPDVDGALTVLNGVAADGALTVVGASWHPAGDRFQAVSAVRAGGWATSTLDSMDTPSVYQAVGGDPEAGGWIAGRTFDLGIFARTCDPQPTGSRARRQAVRASRGAAVSARRAPPVETSARAARRRPAARQAAGRSPIQQAVAPSFEDIAADAGLPTTSLTWGGVIADFDGDGADDIFLGRHGDAPLLLRRQGDGFVDTGVDLGRVDRHGCAAADIDRSGLPDLFCSVGAARGTGVKANELWLDPGGPEPRRHPTAGGALEPYGRGRIARFLDVDQDRDADLFVAQESFRGDGLPSVDRLYRNVGRADLRSRPASGVPPAIGAANLDLGDVDRDGRTDLLLVYEDVAAARPQTGVRFYRNVGGRFRDVTDAYRIRSIEERDAELVDLDGDRRLDLVQTSWTGMVVSLQRDGRFRRVWSGTFGGGGIASDTATGDIDGDGDQDLYVLRQKRAEGDHDLILLNDGDGRSFTTVAAPSARGGLADDVLVIDHDGNGTTDFLALNGLDTEPGPIQLVTLATDA